MSIEFAEYRESDLSNPTYSEVWDQKIIEAQRSHASFPSFEISQQIGRFAEKVVRYIGVDQNPDRLIVEVEYWRLDSTGERQPGSLQTDDNKTNIYVGKEINMRFLQDGVVTTIISKPKEQIVPASLPVTPVKAAMVFSGPEFKILARGNTVR